jgi:hypothetical protein
MGLKSLVSRNISTAFDLVKDFAVEATFAKSSNSAFNFASGDLVQSTSNIKAKAVVIEKGKQESTKTTQLMFRTADVDVSAYDSVTIDKTTWKLGPQISSPGDVVTLVTLFKV